MKIIIKTLQGKVFEVNVEGDTTVMQLKELIDSSKPIEGQEFPADQIKLINLGKIMENEKTLSEYNLKEGSFLVVMVQKAVKAKEPEKPKSTTEAQPAPALNISQQPVQQQPAPAPAPQPAQLNAEQEA